jgi:putative hydrolase of the HAD superfamily
MSERLTDYPTTQVVSFDLWLTLIKSDGTTFKRLRNEEFRHCFAPAMDAVEFDTLARAVDKQADRVAEARGNDVMFEERVAMIAEAAGAPQPTQATLDSLYETQTRLFAAHRPVLINPRTPAILDGVRGDYETALISNTGFIHGQEIRGALDDLGIGDSFDYMFFSNETGFAKPSAEMFGQLISASDVAPHEITHTGDNYNADVAGPQRLGMNAIHLAAGMTIEDII